MFSLSPWIFATENCNLRCPYCFEGHVNKNMSKEVWSATSEHFIQLVQDHVIRRTPVSYTHLDVYKRQRRCLRAC